MQLITGSQCLKLGTAVRYLIDAPVGEPLEGQHVIDNIKAVIDLMPKVGYEQTRSSPPAAHLQKLHDDFLKVCQTQKTLTSEQKEILEREARKLRTLLFAEGENIKMAPVDLSSQGQVRTLDSYSVKQVIAVFGKLSLTAAMAIVTGLVATLGFAFELGRKPVADELQRHKTQLAIKQKEVDQWRTKFEAVNQGQPNRTQ
ncbi:MAG TPA: hypothetical protein VNT81_09075 [Vicinamibacterales bacterium]|nr:hypothetical protein [Vicinamibacterales bacterium]